MQPDRALDRLLVSTLALETATEAEDLRSLLDEREALLDRIERSGELDADDGIAQRIAEAEARVLGALQAQRTLIATSIRDAANGRHAADRYGRAA